MDFSEKLEAQIKAEIERIVGEHLQKVEYSSTMREMVDELVTFAVGLY